jgi:flagellar basal body rod protein FlgG
MLAAERWLDVTAQNLANTSTNGYKKEFVGFEDGLTRELHAQGAFGAPIGSNGAGPVMREQHTVWTTGHITPTGNDLDVAIGSNHGLFKVLTPQGERFTRHGGFQTNERNELVSEAGFPVVDVNNRPIRLPVGSKIDIATDGSINVDAQFVAKIGVFEGDFAKQGHGLYTVNGAAEVQGSPQLVPGSIEGSNVNAVEEMIQLIKLNRIFEMGQRSAQTHDQMTQKLIESASR